MNGHPYTPENRYERPDRPGRTDCYQCVKDRGREWKRQRRRTAFERRLPVGCRVRLVPGNSCEGLEGEVIGHRHRVRKPTMLVIRVDGKLFLHTALPSWVERIEEGQVAA